MHNSHQIIEILFVITIIMKPTTYEQAIFDPKWQEAIVVELHALEQNNNFQTSF